MIFISVGTWWRVPSFFSNSYYIRKKSWKFRSDNVIRVTRISPWCICKLFFSSVIVRDSEKFINVAERTGYLNHWPSRFPFILFSTYLLSDTGLLSDNAFSKYRECVGWSPAARSRNNRQTFRVRWTKPVKYKIDLRTNLLEKVQTQVPWRIFKYRISIFSKRPLNWYFIK